MTIRLASFILVTTLLLMLTGSCAQRVLEATPKFSQSDMLANLTTGRVMSVQGIIPAEEMGVTLPHEHVMVDFIGADRVSPSRYDPAEVARVVRPYLERLRSSGLSTLVECTPAYLGRDVRLLKQLSEATGLNILTNTGYYGAGDEKYLPAHALTESADQLSRRWIAEWSGGIDGTDIRPGFIKTGIDGAPLTDMDRKLIEAAAKTHLKTGLAIACHCPDPAGAMDVLAILQRNKVSPSAMIWVHADSVEDLAAYELAARSGAWVEFDHVSDGSIDQHVRLLTAMKQLGLLGRVLISHDAGWYHVGEAHGGKFRHYDAIADKLLPALKANGFTLNDVRQLMESNPRRAFAIEVRGLDEPQARR
jgi:phosphotriesterase-related protein